MNRGFPFCGANGTRTRDPHTASVVRYQLRHSPLVDFSNVHAALVLPQIRRHAAYRVVFMLRSAPY